MKHLLLIAGLFCSLGIQAQVTGISVETYVLHDGTIPALTGYTTYHIYANTTSAEDFVSAVYGDSENPLGISATGNVFQSSPGFMFGNEVNPLFFEAFPVLEFDSWMTIGMLSAEDNGVLGNIGLDDAMADFTATGSFYVDDPIGGSWYNTMPCDPLLDPSCVDTYPQFGGASNQVLLAQITTDGNFSGVFNLQVFNGGDQLNNQYVDGLGFSNDASAVFGCTDLAASNYDPTATNDDYSCVLPCTLELVVEAVTTPTCNGDNDGGLVISATGAQGSDDYYLGEDDEIASNFGNFNNLLAGTYYVMVEDGAGCQSFEYVEISETADVTVQAVLIEAISCNNTNDAVLEVNGGGGDGNIQYYLAGDDPSTMSSNTLFENLSAGTYSVVGIDGNGCTSTSIATQVSNPSAINVYLTGVSDASCADIADGEIVVSSNGGAAPATIQYVLGGLTYPSSPIQIAAGTYDLVAMDINGCTGTLDNQIVIGPDAIEVNASSTAVACTDDENGIVLWAPSGGAEGFSIMLGDSAITGSSYEGLAVGFYTVEVTDANGCTAQEIVEVLNAEPVIAATSVTDPLCNGNADGVVLVTGTGGTGVFQFSDNGNDFSNNGEFDNLSAGEYIFYAQDENGCISGSTAIVDDPEAIVISSFINEASAVNGDGFIDISITGGTPDYSYEWMGADIYDNTVDGIATQDLDGLSSGTYSITVTDGNGCTAVEQFNIVTFDSVEELANGIKITIYPNPSTGVFNIQWDGFVAGDLQYTLVDALGRQVVTGVWSEVGESFNTEMNLRSLENGLYSLNIVSNGVPASIQLVKAN